MNNVLILIASALFGSCSGLRLLDYKLDGVVDIHRKPEVALKCVFDAEGAEIKYIRWLRNNKEFYKFITPNKVEIPSDSSVKVKGEKSNETVVVLGPLSIFNSGYYQCEAVTTEPPFHLSVEKRILFYALPQEGPKLEGIPVRREAYFGSELNFTCTTSPSYPASQISWLIADQPLPRSKVTYIGNGRVRSSTSQIAVKTDQIPFNPITNDLLISCKAFIPGVYQYLAHLRLVKDMT